MDLLCSRKCCDVCSYFDFMHHVIFLVSLSGSNFGWNACFAIVCSMEWSVSTCPRAGTWLTVYRAPQVWSAIAKIKGIVFWVALPGAQALTGFRLQRKQYTWLVQTYKKYFIRITLGQIAAKSANWNREFFDTKWKYRALLWSDFRESRPEWKLG